MRHCTVLEDERVGGPAVNQPTTTTSASNHVTLTPLLFLSCFHFLSLCFIPALRDEDCFILFSTSNGLGCLEWKVALQITTYTTIYIVQQQKRVDWTRWQIPGGRKTSWLRTVLKQVSGRLSAVCVCLGKWLSCFLGNLEANQEAIWEREKKTSNISEACRKLVLNLKAG